jgi:6-phosphogluconolactonase (cycloisomerase 2 family)
MARMQAFAQQSPFFNPTSAMKDARLTALFILIALLAGYPIRLDAQFVYTFGQINKANKILGYSISANGFLVPVPGSPFTAGTEPSTIAADPKGKYVYVVNSPTLVDGGNISAFRVSSTGDLSPVPGSPFGLGYYGSLVVDPAGKFLFVIDISGSSDPLQPPPPNYVSVFRIGPSGSLEQVPGSPFVAGANANPLVVDQTGQYLYVGVQDEVPFWAPEPPYIVGYQGSQYVRDHIFFFCYG